MIDTALVSEEWDAALAHAGIDRSQTRLYLAEGLGLGGGGRGAGAVWFPPGDEIVEDDQFPDASQLDDANDPEHINLHRVSLRVDDDVAVTAGRMRHELEHARQYDALGRRIFKLQDFLEQGALPHRAGGLDGCAGHLINAIPTELDANAAASMHVGIRHPEELARIRRGDCRVLACSLVGPEPFETLPARMIAFTFIHRGLCEQATRSGMSLREILNDCYEGAWELWSGLEAGLPQGK